MNRPSRSRSIVIAAAAVLALVAMAQSGGGVLDLLWFGVRKLSFERHRDVQRLPFP